MPLRAHPHFRDSFPQVLRRSKLKLCVRCDRTVSSMRDFWFSRTESIVNQAPFFLVRESRMLDGSANPLRPDRHHRSYICVRRVRIAVQTLAQGFFDERLIQLSQSILVIVARQELETRLQCRRMFQVPQRRCLKADREPTLSPSITAPLGEAVLSRRKAADKCLFVDIKPRIRPGIMESDV